jgi:hypothetical protein
LKKVRAIKVNLEQVLDSHAPDASVRDFVTPKKATILNKNGGTLVEAEEGGYFIVPVGEWFQSSYNGKMLPQVDAFNKLQDMGFTAIKDKIVRHAEKVEEKPKVEAKIAEVKPEIKPVVKSNGQAIRSQNNVGLKKVNQAVASNIKSQKEN